MGNLEGLLREFFLTHRTKAQKIRGKFRSIFRNKIRSSNKIFRAKFTLQTCHLKKKRARKGINPPVRGTNGPVRGTDPPVTGTEGL